MSTSIIMESILSSEEPATPEGGLIACDPNCHGLRSEIARVRYGGHILVQQTCREASKFFTLLVAQLLQEYMKGVNSSMYNETYVFCHKVCCVYGDRCAVESAVRGVGRVIPRDRRQVHPLPLKCDVGFCLQDHNLLTKHTFSSTSCEG